MVRRDSNRGDGSDSDMASREAFSELTKNPWVVILIAALTGTGSGTFFGRPDPFTGQQGRDLAARISALEHQQALDDGHRSGANGKLARIRTIEQCCVSLRRDMEHAEEAIKELRIEVGRP